MRDPDPTTLHVGQALAGDRDSLAWMTARFSPLLLEQARYRLGHQLRRYIDPEDLVNDVWLRALPQLRAVRNPDGRLTPAVLRYLGTTLLRRVRDLYDKHVASRPPADADQPVELASAEQSGVITRIVRAERSGIVGACIGRLEALDREVLLLRGIEQRGNDEVAALLGIEPGTASARYRRALERLRQELPGSVFEDLET